MRNLPKLSFLSALLLMAGLMSNCRRDFSVPPSGNDSIPQQTGNNPENKRFIALGDSYTIGQSVPESDRFPAQTVAILRDSGINISQLKYIASTGWTTLALENAINIEQPQSLAPYSIVTLLIGVNDQYQTRDTTGYRERFTRLLNTSIALAGNDRRRVFVLSIPDYSVTPFARGLDTAAIRRQIDWFNSINRSVTLENNISYTDITPSTREAAIDKTLLAQDSLHPSGKEYAKWSARLAPLMKQVLQ
jgi:lysophospholipase L1-like esterase